MFVVIIVCIGFAQDWYISTFLW